MPPRNKLFLHKKIKSHIHAARYETTDMDNVFVVYFDSQNPKIHDSLSDSFMNQPVGCFAKKRVQIRRLLIGFGRDYVVNTAIRYRKFGPCLEIITMFYKKLPDDKFDITTTLVENFNNEVKEKGSIHHFPNYFNNYTYYYPFIDQILLLEAKHGFYAYKKRFLCNTILSQSLNI